MESTFLHAQNSFAFVDCREDFNACTAQNFLPQSEEISVSSDREDRLIRCEMSCYHNPATTA